MDQIKFVLIGNSLKHTEYEYGINLHMNRMKNKIFKVKEIYNRTVVIYDVNSKKSYTFSKRDVENYIVDSLPMPQPEIFNPATLDI